jgi:phage shock protein PspC (stress-responsive transcriptional regulator)
MVRMGRRSHDVAMNDTTTPVPNDTVPALPLVRPREGRVVAGVAAALASRLGVGPGWIRLAFVLLVFAGGLGALLYLVGWLVIREEGEDEPIASRWLGGLDDVTSWLGVALIVIAGFVIVGATGLIRGELLWAAALLFAGILLYRGDLVGRRDEEGEPPPAPSPATSSPTTTLAPPVAPVAEEPGDVRSADAPAPQPPPPRPPRPARRPRPPRQPSILGRLTFGLSLVGLGVMAAMDAADLVDLGVRHYVAAAVLALGLGLLVGAFWGRARWLVLVGILALPFLLAASVVRVPLDADAGDRLIRPVEISQLAPTYEMSAGEMTIDLRRLDLGTEPVAIEAKLGFGQIDVIVPAGVNVEVHSRVGIGALDVLGIERAGFDIERTITGAGEGPTVGLDLDTGIGQIRVVRSR